MVRGSKKKKKGFKTEKNQGQRPGKMYRETAGQQGVRADHECWGKTYLGSNLSVPLSRYLGKLLNIYDSQFPSF